MPRQPAINKVRRTRDVVGVRRSQEGSKTGDIVRFPQPRERNLCKQGAEFLRIVEQLGVNRRFDGTRCNRVDSDAELTKFHAQVTCQHFESAFTRAVGREVGERLLFVDGADVDDLAGSFGLKEMPDHLLCGEEDALEVDVENAIIVFFGHFPKRRVSFDAGVVHENVEPAEMLDGRDDELPYVSRVRKIRLDHEATTARCFDDAQRFLRSAGGTVVVDDHIRALLGETFSDCATDALAAAGDESDFACESHKCLHFFVGPLPYCFVVVSSRMPGMFSRIRYTLVCAARYRVLPSSSPHASL